ncbi:MAG: hypothetical protein ACPGMQ_08795 [Pirellulales bacterium]|jgi:hypothetical protein
MDDSFERQTVPDEFHRVESFWNSPLLAKSRFEQDACRKSLVQSLFLSVATQLPHAARGDFFWVLCDRSRKCGWLEELQ